MEHPDGTLKPNPEPIDDAPKADVELHETNRVARRVADAAVAESDAWQAYVSNGHDEHRFDGWCRADEALEEAVDEYRKVARVDG